MMALQPIPFQVPQAHIFSHIWSPFIRRFFPSAQTPVLTIMLLRKPSVEKIQNAMAYTSTQLIKFGTVVKVCTKRRNFKFFISQRKIANAMGIQLVSMPMPLMARVFFIVFKISLTVALFLTSSPNHLNPTNFSMVNVSPAL